MKTYFIENLNRIRGIGSQHATIHDIPRRTETQIATRYTQDVSYKHSGPQHHFIIIISF